MSASAILKRYGEKRLAACLSACAVHWHAKRPNHAVNSDVPVKSFVLVSASGGTPVTLVRWAAPNDIPPITVASTRAGVVSCVAIDRTYLFCAAEYEGTPSGLDLCDVRWRCCGSDIRYRRPHFLTSQRMARGTFGHWMRLKSALDFCRPHAGNRNIWTAALVVMRNMPNSAAKRDCAKSRAGR